MSGTSPLRKSAYHYDETLHRDGSMLPAWQSLLAMIDELSEEQIKRRQKDIDRQLRANGLGYYTESSTATEKRPWTLDLLPMLFDGSSWNTLSEGLTQRARLKQALYQDIYGEQRLLKEGVLPAAMLYSHNGYLRDIVNPENATKQETVLPMYACDIVRSSAGEWMAAQDICQYPSGMGYTLENRVVLSRVLQHTYKDYRVRRIATYFRQLQNYILANSQRSARCVLLSYPSSHPHYFEFAWLAKYLGYALVEPADLTVRDHNVYVKTVVGLQAVDVILRFIDDSEVDPLVIGSHKQQGVPGLVEAARRGGVQILNPLGTGVLDNPALNSIMPQLCDALLSEPLKLKSVPTRWLGDTEQYQYVVANIEQLILRNINSREQIIKPAQLTRQQKSSLLEELSRSPASYVAEETNDGSLAPSLVDGQKHQGHISIRTYLVANETGFEAMPGGLCLMESSKSVQQQGAENADATMGAIGNPIGSKDVWILSSGPVVEDTLIKSYEDDFASGLLDDELPSRIAESVFWLGRNAERVENILRVLRSIMQSFLDEQQSHESILATAGMQGLFRAVTAVTGTLPGFSGKGSKRRIANPDKELISLLQDTTRMGTLANSLQQWQFSASSVNDRLSSEQLRVFERLDNLQTVLCTLHLPANFSSDSDALNQVLVVIDDLLLATSAFTGLAHENVTRGDIWQFMMLGRGIERAGQIAVTVSSMLSVERDNKRLLEYLLRLFDSVMTYRSRYRSALDIRMVLNLLLLDEANPRSLAYQYNRIDALVASLPGKRYVTGKDALRRLAISGLSRARLADPESLLSTEIDTRQNLQQFLQVLGNLPSDMTDAVTTLYFTHTETRQELGQTSVPVSDVLRTVGNSDNGGVS